MKDYRAIQDRRKRVKAFLAQDNARREAVMDEFRARVREQEADPLARLPELLANLRAEQPHEVVEDECA